MQVKDLGVLYDEGVTVELPISPTQIGNYQVRIKTPSGKEKTKNIKITSLSDKFIIPNFNGQKKFEKGVNTFYLYYYNPDRQRMVINGFQTWAVEFKERSSDTSELIQQLIKRIEELENKKCNCTVVPSQDVLTDGSDIGVTDGLEEFVTDGSGAVQVENNIPENENGWESISNDLAVWIQNVSSDKWEVPMGTFKKEFVMRFESWTGRNLNRDDNYYDKKDNTYEFNLTLPSTGRVYIRKK